MIAGIEFSRKAATGRHIRSYRQLRVKDLPNVPTWRLEVESNQRPSAPKAPDTTTQPTTPLKPQVRLQPLGWFPKAAARMIGDIPWFGHTSVSASTGSRSTLSFKDILNRLGLWTGQRACLSSAALYLNLGLLCSPISQLGH